MSPAKPSSKPPARLKTETATFAAGCFWGVEATFAEVKGVVSTLVGYTGGHTEDPTYKDVCSDETSHAEAVQVKFDPRKVSYEKLLELFWKIHDPTTLNRQGPDVGSQYRSVIFFHSGQQKKLAMKSMKEQQKKRDRKIVTDIVPARTFYKAESYHQKYFEKHGKVCHF